MQWSIPLLLHKPLVLAVRHTPLHCHPAATPAIRPTAFHCFTAHCCFPLLHNSPLLLHTQMHTAHHSLSTALLHTIASHHSSAHCTALLPTALLPCTIALHCFTTCHYFPRLLHTACLTVAEDGCAQYLGYATYQPLSWGKAKSLTPVTVLYIANVGFALLSIQHLNIPMYNSLKRLTPVLVLIEKVRSLPWPLSVSLALFPPPKHVNLGCVWMSACGSIPALAPQRIPHLFSSPKHVNMGCVCACVFGVSRFGIN